MCSGKKAKALLFKLTQALEQEEGRPECELTATVIEQEEEESNTVTRGEVLVTVARRVRLQPTKEEKFILSLHTLLYNVILVLYILLGVYIETIQSLTVTKKVDP
ncbi:hypothetical protein ACSX1C_00325 [Pseudomonas sp. MBLB4123]|uniref:hypothetical protein n=1 Tax=Pseudomonas sp. MBLB4123 TaxID=3451557 RepID=UPI003F74B09F